MIVAIPIFIGLANKAVRETRKQYSKASVDRSEAMAEATFYVALFAPMNKLPKHHYIPVFYLKQWSGPDGRVTAFRRPHGDKVVATPKPPSHTGYVRGLYWLDGAADPDMANRVETLIMGRIDHNAALAHLCLSEIKHAHTDDGVRQEMA
jgi:hypothetical protein